MLTDYPQATRHPLAPNRLACEHSPEYHEAEAHRLLSAYASGARPTTQDAALALAHATLAQSMRLGAIGCNGIEMAAR